MQNFINKNGKLVTTLVALLALVIGGGTVALVVDDDGSGPNPAHTVTIVSVPKVTSTVSTATPGVTAKITSPVKLVAQAAPGLEGNLRGETPTAKNLEAQEDAAKRDDLPNVQPDAAPSQRGCASRFVQNYSTRRGVAPRLIVLHETVSRNVAGWNDVNAIVNLFNQARSQASSNYVLDREGHCAYIVRESDKAWTQASGNPWSISFETINTASTVFDKNYINGAGRVRLISVVNDISKRWNIPLRRGRVSNCTPTRAGIIDHTSFGACGGGHVDIGPFRNAIDPIISDARKLCVRRYHTAGHSVPARCKA